MEVLLGSLEYGVTSPAGIVVGNVNSFSNYVICREVLFPKKLGFSR